MEKGIKILLILTSIGLLAASCNQPYNYTIDHNGVTEHTQEYKMFPDGCARFNNKVVCGTFTITKNK